MFRRAPKHWLGFFRAAAAVIGPAAGAAFGEFNPKRRHARRKL
jgi:hypothetical protein